MFFHYFSRFHALTCATWALEHLSHLLSAIHVNKMPKNLYKFIHGFYPRPSPSLFLIGPPLPPGGPSIAGLSRVLFGACGTEGFVISHREKEIVLHVLYKITEQCIIVYLSRKKCCIGDSAFAIVDLPNVGAPPTVLAILLWILFFIQKKSIESICSLVSIFFQNTDIEVRPEHGKILNSTIFSSRVSNTISEWLIWSRYIFFIIFCL